MVILYYMRDDDFIFTLDVFHFFSKLLCSSQKPDICRKYDDQAHVR